jgi:seryl-tRNA synthetase
MNGHYAQSSPARCTNDQTALDRIDGLVRRLAVSMGADEMQYPALIAREILEQAEYTQAFPHLLMSVRGRHLDEREEGARWCLSPAVCYHTYAQLADRVLADPCVVTARGRCFRAEAECEAGVRQVEFNMREIVLLGAPAWIDESAEQGRVAIEAMATEVGLGGKWVVGEDPFFLPAAAGKALMQRLLKVKLEYQWPEAGGLALASINRHGTFFGQRFRIAMPDGAPVHTMCLAVGLDRWAHHASGGGTR